MKLELIDTKAGRVIFHDCEKSIILPIDRVTYNVYGRVYFTYKRRRIYLSEFVLQQDGTRLYFAN